MVDPGADASIGGMVACGASGTAAVKYGTMRENVLALTAVLPPTKIRSSRDNDLDWEFKPEVVQCGTTALKSSAGYNLTALLTGSEGTLAIITEATVKIHPMHNNNVIAAVCAFDDLHAAAQAVTMIRLLGVPVSRIELLDEVSVQAFNNSLHSTSEKTNNLEQLEVKPTLFLEFCSHSENSVNEDLSAAKHICIDEFGATNFRSASDEMTRHSLWAARHRLYYSSIALKEGATPRSTLLTDACVPLSQFSDVLVATASDVKKFGVVGPCFGHAGDGNFHCIMPMTEDDSKDYKDAVFQVNENLIERVISVGGTCTGEHGVGYGKKKYLSKMYGEGGVDLLRSVKKSFDPWNIMNPSKIVDL
jgi:D-lactate dehydrogenase (cytochrome)